ncbi:tripartite tricarboxylate transporter permease [Desulfovibrio sp. OttesenSCG-928-I05]|nr:tripartite tricarboxylate transporter permease [Desulfovibrio sp. OttesenSCG-928-I05]
MNADSFLIAGLGYYLTLPNLAFTAMGVFVGMIIGVLPGLGPMLAIILATPMVMKLQAVTAMSVLLGVYVGGACGGAISAILLKIPGTPINAATVFDGYPMKEKGESPRAIGLAITASAYGGAIGGIFLIFCTPLLAAVSMKFAPAEYFALALTGVICIVIVSQDSILKGSIMGVLGLLASTIGIDPFINVERFTFGSVYLMNGLNLVATVLGLYAMAEMIFQVQRGRLSDSPGIKGFLAPFSVLTEPFKQWKNLLGSSTIGTVIGALPGVGAVVAALVAYSAAKSCSSYPEKFGTGIPDGIIASEASNNACVGGSLIPTLTLALPGTAIAALMLAVLMLFGFLPGPDLFNNSPEMVGGLFLAYGISNIFLLILGLLFTPLFVSALNMKKQYLIPVIMLLCVVGAYGIETNITDVGVMVILGFLGYFLVRNGYPVAPFVLAQVLGNIIEYNFRRTLTLSGNDYSVFFTRPVTFGILIANIVAFTLILTPLLPWLKRRFFGGRNG